MKITRFIVAVAALMLSCEAALAAPKYVQSPALDKVISTPVGKVRSGQVQVPVITWGGDINTIHANGDSRTTASGSIFKQLGLDVKLVREDVFANQVKNYLSGKSPYLRGTLSMVNMAGNVLNKDPRTKPIIIYQLSESAGGDALVVKSGIRTAKDLRGKTIAVQAYGPHVYYLGKVLSDAGLSFSDVKIKWLPDLTGTDDTPMAAFYESDIDAAMTIIPDALALTSGGNVGTGSEQSVRGATIMLSTKTADRVIADVYAVRADYFSSNRSDVEKFVHGLLKGQESAEKLVANKVTASRDYSRMMANAAEILLDAKEAISDAEGLYADANHVGYSGNVRFFTDRHYPRNLTNRTKEIQKSLSVIGLTNGRTTLDFAGWDFNALKSGLSNVQQAETPKFDSQRVATVVTKRQQQGTLGEGELFSFEVYFKPNQKEFSEDLYSDSFEKVVDLASTYGGALITVEGHSDPHGYLKKKSKGESAIVLKRVRQSAKNLSVTRALAVRDAVINFGKNKHVKMDESQFAIVGHGMEMPKTGMCGSDPCPIKTAQEWKDNMRVVFRIIQVEAEAEVFSPL